MNKRVKVVITGYYDIEMNTAEANYGTTDPDEMLAIDKHNIEQYPEEMVQDLMNEGVQVDLSWEN